MRTLKDIKNALKDIDDDTLEGLYFGSGEGAEGEIRLIAQETGSISKEQIGFPEVFDKYPKLCEIDKLIQNIIKAQKILDNEEEDSEELSETLWEEGLTDSFFDEDKKSSSFQELKSSIIGSEEKK